ncbi:MAG: MAPEG family protein [Pseudolabrys sp.]
MTLLSTENPIFVTYMIAASIMVLKLMGQGWMTVYRMLRVDGGWATPEDFRGGVFNRKPLPEQLELVGARLVHTVAYATKQTHEVRATLYTIGSLVVIIMALYVLAAAIL